MATVTILLITAVGFITTVNVIKTTILPDGILIRGV
jgi:hypothetical protein